MTGQWTHWGSYGHAMAWRLRAVRRARGMSQHRLAELAGVSRNVISNLERNENAGRKPSDPQLSTVYRLAQALAVPPAALLPGVGEQILPVCSPEQLPVALRWPGTPEDLRRFSPRHLALAQPGDVPEFVEPWGN